jgi:molecular chaperone IbpA
MTELTVGRLNFGPLNRALIGFDQLFDTLEYKATTNYPPYNIIKSDEDNYTIEVAVAGFKKKEITVQVDNNKLSVKGSKEKEDTKVQYLHHALSARNFTHQFTIAENMVIKSAALEDGVLKVLLERIVPESKKVRTIEILEA